MIIFAPPLIKRYCLEHLITHNLLFPKKLCTAFSVIGIGQYCNDAYAFAKQRIQTQRIQTLSLIFPNLDFECSWLQACQMYFFIPHIWPYEALDKLSALGMVIYFHHPLAYNAQFQYLFEAISCQLSNQTH